MGVVALLRKDILSAAYNFTKAYTSPAPIQGAKQQLYICYDEAMKMYHPVASMYWYQMEKKPEISNPADVRRQIWIFSAASRQVPPISKQLHTKQAHCRQLSSAELSRRFSMTYIHTIGILFTEIGLEGLYPVAEEALVYLEGLLSYGEPGNFPNLRVIQVVTINIHILEHLRPKAKSDPVVWTTAVQFALEIFAILAERLRILIDICAWDHPQMEVLCLGVHIWIEWMRLSPKDWSKRRPRPIFTVKYADRPKLDNIRDRIDTTWKIIGDLMTEIALILSRHISTVFPSVSKNKDESHRFDLSPFPEGKHMFGFNGFLDSQMFRQQYFCDNKWKIGRGRNLVRLTNVYKFGIQILCERYGILRYNEVNRSHQFFTEVKVRKPVTALSIGGLEKFHHQFWVQQYNESRCMCSSATVQSGDCNSRSKIFLRTFMSRDESKSRGQSDSPLLRLSLPNQIKLDLWERFVEEGFSTEIIVQPFHFVLDTNCFVRNLHLVKVLLSFVTHPLYIPVSVILELKGLAKGGLRVKDRQRYSEGVSFEAQEKIIDGMELAENCKLALAFIAETMDYFLIITSTAKIIPVKTPYSFISDDYFDPSMKNDDRILDACKYLEAKDWKARSLDTQRRIYRQTVLVTGDRFLRIKSLAVYIPSRPISSILFWFMCCYFPEIYQRLLKISKDTRRNQYTKRKQDKVKQVK